ncbi:hypothetical protein [Asanoa sp. NPDC050611]|uniref:hypothetical protein n=1 Tax=Asanoa sp. NPDC050611 TaxID=3157098 RepID=UPI0033ED53EC
MKARVLLVVAVVGLAGCDAAEAREPGPDLAVAESSPAQRYRGSGFVIEDATHGPQLCETATASLVPQCQGLDIAGWSWDAVAHTTRGATRFGRFEVTGTYDGSRLTLTEPPGPPRPPADRSSPDFTSPCPAPAGGWRVVDDAKATDAALERARALVASTPDAGGLWVDLRDDTNDPRTLVLNVRTTGDPATHEKRLRRVWGGALCVSPATRTTAELERIQAGVEKSFPGVFQAGIDVVANRVSARIYVATDETRRAADERFGPGAVELVPFLRPV